jgi:hypothetical protein
VEQLRGHSARDALLAFLAVVFGGGALIQLAHQFLGLGTTEGNAAFEALPLVAILVAHRFLVGNETPEDD